MDQNSRIYFPWDRLPDEMFALILNKLPEREQVRCCTVSTSWCLLINELCLQRVDAVCLTSAFPNLEIRRTIYLLGFEDSSKFELLHFEDERADELHVILIGDGDDSWAMGVTDATAGWGVRRLVLDGVDMLPPSAVEVLIKRLPLWVDHLDVIGWNRQLWDKLTEDGIVFSSLTLSGRDRVSAWYPGRPGARAQPAGLHGASTLVAYCPAADSKLLSGLAENTLTRVRLDEAVNLDTSGLMIFSNLPKLKVLALHGAIIPTDEIWANSIFKGFPALLDLSILSCSGLGEQAIMALADRTSITHIELDLTHLPDGTVLFLPSSATHVVLEIPHSRYFVAQAHVNLEDTPLASLELNLKPPFSDPLLHVQLQLLADLAAAKRTAFSYKLLRHYVNPSKFTTYW